MIETKSVIICIVVQLAGISKNTKQINIKISNNIRPRTEPCGTPFVILAQSLWAADIFTLCYRSFKYESMSEQDSRDSPLACNLHIRNLCGK